MYRSQLGPREFTQGFCERKEIFCRGGICITLLIGLLRVYISLETAEATRVKCKAHDY